MTAQELVNRLQVIGGSFAAREKNTTTYNLKPVTSKKGFSLIELMVTIAIVAILSTVGMVVYANAQRSARITKRAQDLEAIQTALETFRNTTGFYPNVAAAGTFVCLDSLSGINNLTPQYMTLYPRDPIQTGIGGASCYEYTSNGTGAVLAATEYKIRTNDDIPTTEMNDTQYRSRPNLIDPDRDGTADDNCVVTTTGTAQAGWAVYTATSTACNY